jgi:glycerol-3-phosphate dehydrogenase
MERHQIISYYRQQPEIDVLIIGGGINGIGTLRDLALQGVSALLVDRADLCSGASAASTRLAHGGLRYLENGEFRLVREALHERNRLLQNAPHAVRALRFTIPIYSRFSGLLNAPLKFLRLLERPSERGSLVISLGLMMYDWFTRDSRVMPPHRMLSRSAALQQHPGLNPQIVSAGTYYDAALHYAERIAVELALDAEADGAPIHVLNYASATGAAADTVQMQDDVSGETFAVRPKIVINATGAWIDFVNRRLRHDTKFIGGTKGSHIVVDHPELLKTLNGSALYFENKDGRLLFVAPIEDRVLIGTSDIRIDDPDQAVCTDEEIDYFFTSLAHVLPGIQIDRSQIVFHFSGVRPLPRSEAGFAGMISRDHSIQVIEPDSAIHFPVYALIGGKWTSYRALSEQTTDKVLSALGRSRRASTIDLRIGGGKNYPQTPEARAAWLKRVSAETSVAEARLERLFERYGTRAEAVAAFSSSGEDQMLQRLPDYSQREIAFICLNEKVVHLDDLILRRSLIGLLGHATGNVLKELGQVAGTALGWSPEQIQQDIERTAALLHQRHGVPSEQLAAAGSP